MAAVVAVAVVVVATVAAAVAVAVVAVMVSAIMNSRELADAIRAGGEWKALHGAANHQGFWGRSAA